MIDRACISINAKCNLQCKYCHFGSKMNQKSALKSEFTNQEIEVILSNLFNYVDKNHVNKLKLGIVGSGEPMLNFTTIQKIVSTIASHPHSSQFALYMISNGTLLTEEQLSFMYQYRNLLSFNISIDGPKEIHELMRTDFDATFLTASRYKDLFGIMPLVNCVVSRHTITQQEKVIDFFLEHGFNRVNFSIIFGVEDPHWIINRDEYNEFLMNAQKKGLIVRQLRPGFNDLYDCTKYGTLCGVGITNIFIAKSGVYPCGRFLDVDEHKVTNFDASFDEIEAGLIKYTPVPKGECYYEYHNIGGKK